MKALIIGATGAVGSELFTLLKTHTSCKEIRVIARKANPHAHDKVRWVVAPDFLDPALKAHFRGITHLFICIGTTQAKTPDKTQYHLIDYGIPKQMAEWAAEADVYHALVISSIGASAKSRIFYLKTKGEMEEALIDTHIPRIDFLRPATIIGSRPERRLGENIGIFLDKIFRPIIPKNYRAIQARQLAKRMIEFSNNTEEGVFYHYNKTLLD